MPESCSSGRTHRSMHLRRGQPAAVLLGSLLWPGLAWATPPTVSQPPVASGAPTAQSAPASPTSEDPEGALGLLSDLERIVDAQEYDQWFIDSQALDELLPDLMPSVCRASPSARQLALGVAGARREQAGDPRELWQRAGRLTDEVETALHYDRQHEALERALELADTDCPFWAPPVRGFPGRQTTRHRFAASVETGGLGQLRIADRRVHFGGGGAGRVLASYRLSDGLSLLGGGEFGGGAMVRPNTSASEFVINYFPAIPLVVRFHDVAWHYELETAAVAVLQADNPTPSFGVRVGAGVGFSTLRVRSILPWAGAVLAAEHYFPGGGRSYMQFVRAGVRVGFFWDPE